MICACVSESLSRSALEHYSMAEIRIDMVGHEAALPLFSLRTGLIATCREGSYSRDERLGHLLAAADAGASFIDVEYEADEEFKSAVRAKAAQRNAGVIVSFHDFESTPATDRLESIIDKSVAMGADIVKLVTTAMNERDAARVLSLYGIDRPKPLIAFCMGKPGMITRVACVALGAPFTYASAEGMAQTAPNQISYEDMRMILGKF
jgi:3-dehydroquinate dehydratase I